MVFIMAMIRGYEKCYRTRKWTLDDSIFFLSFAAGISFIALAIAVICGGAYGYHSWDLKMKALTQAVILRATVLQITAGLFAWLVKLALFSLIYHSFKPLTYIRRLVYVGVLISGLYHFAAVSVNLIACIPRQRPHGAPYLFALPGDTCGKSSGRIHSWSMATAGVNLLTDLYLFALPIPAILQLDLPLNKKRGVLLIFSTGASGCIMSVLAIYYRQRAFGDKSYGWRADVTYNIVPVAIVTIIETAVGIIIPCMAACARLISRHSDSIVSTLGSIRFILLPASATSRLSTNNAGQGANEQCELREEKPKVDTIDVMLMQIRVSEHQTDYDLGNRSKDKHLSLEKLQETRSG
ncbi:hypothetical protein IQ07DRAFT_292546 [Pyrenochaeta sp. DS3sAY3a]|nr:hypothetical protein IQ07DRAFT_292546 [Pyrenochaeta sp. DS3sAY3a]